MKKIIITIVLSNILAFGIAAQTIAPPPKAQILEKKSADAFNAKTKTFESAEGGFKVYFPVKPEKRINQLENPFGLSDFIIYSAAGVSAIYGVTYFDTPTIITEESIKKLNYDRQKEALIDGLNAKFISEQEFTGKDLSGMEYVLTNGGNTITLRAFFANQRLFRLLIITSGPKGKISAAKARLNQNLIKKFFDSFTITKIPEPIEQKPELPEDFGVSIEGESLYSSFFGLSMNLPAGYSVLEKEEAEFVRELGAEINKDSKSKYKDLINNSIQNTGILLIATKTAGSEDEDAAVFVVGAEPSSFPVFKPESMADFMSKELLDTDEILTLGVQKIKIDEIDFAWYETQNTTDFTKQRLYLANVNKLVLEISMTFKSAADLQVMLEALRSIKFEK